MRVSCVLCFFYLKCYFEDIDEDALLSGTPMYLSKIRSRGGFSGFASIRSELIEQPVKRDVQVKYAIQTL